MAMEPLASTIGNATGAAGGKLNAAGSSFQIADSYRGTVVANLSGAIVDGTKVDTSTDTGSGSIAANMPGSTSASARTRPGSACDPRTIVVGRRI